MPNLVIVKVTEAKPQSFKEFDSIWVMNIKDTIWKWPYKI